MGVLFLVPMPTIAPLPLRVLRKQRNWSAVFSRKWSTEWVSRGVREDATRVAMPAGLEELHTVSPRRPVRNAYPPGVYSI